MEEAADIRFTIDELYLLADSLEFTFQTVKDYTAADYDNNQEDIDAHERYVASITALLQHIQNFFDQETTNA